MSLQNRAKGEQLPRILVKYEGKELLALVDTGATNSFIKQELINGNLQLASQTVTLGDGQDREMYGPVIIQLEIANQLTTIVAYGLDRLVEDVVLGVDWLSTEEAAIDRPFILRTDNKALQWLQAFKDDRAKLTRYALFLQEFNYQLEHCPGRENLLPDHLSRYPVEEYNEPIDDDRISPLVESQDTVATPVEITPQLNEMANKKKRRRRTSHIHLSQKLLLPRWRWKIYLCISK